MDSVPAGCTLFCTSRQRFWRAYRRQWILHSLCLGYGAWDGDLWFPRTAHFLFPCQKVHRGSLGVSCHCGHLGRQFASRLYVFQPRLVSRAFGVYRGSFSAVLGSHARFPHHSSMEYSGASRRLNGRCLFPERRLPSSPFCRIHPRVLEFLAREGLSCRWITFLRKFIFHGYHGSCIPAYAHHARHYFWGTFPVRFLHRSALGLERAQLASGPFFLRTRAPELDADSRAGYPWTLFPITPGKVRHSLSCCRRCGFLLYHFQLSVLAWAGLLRKSLLHLIDSDLYFWPGAFVSKVRAALPLATRRVRRGGFDGFSSSRLERRPHFPMGRASDSRARPHFLFRSSLQPIFRTFFAAKPS